MLMRNLAAGSYFVVDFVARGGTGVFLGSFIAAQGLGSTQDASFLLPGAQGMPLPQLGR